MGWRFFSRRPKPEIHLVLDIGTESVKALILEKKPASAKATAGKEEKILVLGSSLEYYDQFSIFFTPQFEREVIKRTIAKAIAELGRETGVKSNSVILGLPSSRFSTSRLRRDNAAKPVENSLLGLPPNIFVSRVISQAHKRKEKGIIGEEERDEILKEVLEEGRKKIARIYAVEKGILPEDLQFLELRILETKIEGYSVLDILNYDGKNLDFRILASFLPKYYLKPDSLFQNLENSEIKTCFSGFFSPIPIIKEMGFEISGIIHEAEGLISPLVQNPEGIFLDIGGEVTQIFLAKDGIFEQISEFNKGGKDFSRVLSERLGLDEPSARDLKHRYVKRDLSEESRRRIRQFFEIIEQGWFKNLKEKLKEMSSGIFPSEFFIFGGGALLPEIEEMLVQGDWEDIPFAYPPKARFLQFPNLNLSPQYISPLLCYYASQIGRGSRKPFGFPV